MGNRRRDAEGLVLSRPSRCPISYLKAKSGELQHGWCVASSARVEEVNTPHFDSLGELWGCFSEKEHEFLEPDPKLKVRPAHFLTV